MHPKLHEYGMDNDPHSLISRRTAVSGIVALSLGAFTGFLRGDTEHDDRGEIDRKKQKLWDAQEAAYRTLLRLKGEDASAVYPMEELDAAFEEVEVTITCMDEGVMIGSGEDEVSIAGSTVLLSDEELDAFVTRLRKLGKRIKKVTYHEGCGACALCCKHKEEAALKNGNAKKFDAETLGKDAAAKLMRKLGMEGEPERIGFDHMDRESHIHPARAAVVDGSGFMNPCKLTNFPSAFEISAYCYPDIQNVVEDLDIAIGIAFGEHGMGKDRFDSRKGGEKFAVVVVEHPTDKDFNRRLDLALRPLLAKYRDTMDIVRMKPPAEALQ